MPVIAASMIRQAGGRPSRSSSAIRRSMAPASLKCTVCTCSTVERGTPAPQGSEAGASVGPMRSRGTPTLTMVVSACP